MTPATETGSRRSEAVRPLLALNAALLAVLAFVTLGPSVEAQSSRPRGQYVAVAGGVNGSSASVLYIVDTTSQELVGITYDMNEKQMTGMGYRNLRQDMADLIGGRAKPAAESRSNSR